MISVFTLGCEIASLKLIDVVDNDRKVKTQFALDKHMTKGNERQRVVISSSLQKQLQKYVDSACSNYGNPLVATDRWLNCDHDGTEEATSQLHRRHQAHMDARNRKAAGL